MPDPRISENQYKSAPKGPFQDSAKNGGDEDVLGIARRPYKSTSNEVERAMAHDLTCLAQHFLSLALRLDGTHPPMHIHAEFQGLDLSLADFNKRFVTYRAVLDK